MTVKEILNRSLQVVGTLVAIFQKAIPYPASLTNWPKLVILCAYGIVYIVVRPKKLGRYIVTISIFLGLGFGLFYWTSLDAKSINTAGKIYVKGELKEEAKKYLENHPEVSEEMYFKSVAYNENEIWTAESLRKNKNCLRILYSLFIFILGFGILGWLEIFAKSNPSQSKGSKQTTDNEGLTDSKKVSPFSKQINDILNNAEKYHFAYYQAEKFRGPSLYFHRRSLEARKTEKFETFLEYVYATLASWGMHRMGKGGSKMQSFDVFMESVMTVRMQIDKAESIDFKSIKSSDWFLLEEIFRNINVMASGTSLVGNSKVMAHLLPNIVPPIDRQYTLKYLYGKTNIKNDLYEEWKLMKEIIGDFFVPIACDETFLNQAKEWIDNQSSFPWDTSVLKVIDNLVIGVRR